MRTLKGLDQLEFAVPVDLSQADIDKLSALQVGQKIAISGARLAEKISEGRIEINSPGAPIIHLEVNDATFFDASGATPANKYRTTNHLDS